MSGLLMDDPSVAFSSGISKSCSSGVKELSYYWKCWSDQGSSNASCSSVSPWCCSNRGCSNGDGGKNWGCWVRDSCTKDGCWLNGSCWPNSGCCVKDSCWLNDSCWPNCGCWWLRDVAERIMAAGPWRVIAEWVDTWLAAEWVDAWLAVAQVDVWLAAASEVLAVWVDHIRLV